MAGNHGIFSHSHAPTADDGAINGAEPHLVIYGNNRGLG